MQIKTLHFFLYRSIMDHYYMGDQVVKYNIWYKQIEIMIVSKFNSNNVVKILQKTKQYKTKQNKKQKRCVIQIVINVYSFSSFICRSGKTKNV